MDLKEIKQAAGAHRRARRIGRGESSGWGRTAGRGEKGYGARSGNARRYAYEGGQMPLYRRIPKRGFTNIFKKQFAWVNVDRLNRYADGDKIDEVRLAEDGLIRIRKDGLKVLGRGELEKKLTIRAHAFSKTARDKIEGKGGQAEVVPLARGRK